MLEFYAGRANLSRCMAASGIRTAAFDLLFGDKAKKRGRNKPYDYGSNSMDVNDTSGFAFCVCIWLRRWKLLSDK